MSKTASVSCISLFLVTLPVMSEVLVAQLQLLAQALSVNHPCFVSYSVVRTPFSLYSVTQIQYFIGCNTLD